MSYWNIMAAVLSLALCCYLVIVSYKRENRSQLAFRLCAGVIAPFCLYLLFAQLDKTDTAHGHRIEHVIIITPGASHDSVDALLDRFPASSLYTLDPKIAGDKKWNATLIFGPAGIAGSETIATASPVIHIVGFGLEEDQLDAFNNVKRIFHPTPLPDHFLAINWNRKVSTGNELIVQGSFKADNHQDATQTPDQVPQPGKRGEDRSQSSHQGQTSAPASRLKILLTGFGVTLDSAFLSAGNASDFELRTTPAQNGRAVYSLIVLRGQDTIEHQKIPFETAAATPLSVLMLAASPDFENKFLKGWLFSNNYSLAVRTTISQDKYNREYLNITGVNSDRINTTFLNNFDLIIADATALQKLPGEELRNIRTAVHENGIGLIVKGDSITPRSLFFNTSFNINQSSITNKQQVHLHLADTSEHLPPLTVERPLLLVPNPSLRPLLQDKEGRVFSASALAGRGRITYTTLANSYNWVLAGDTSQYRQWWSALIRETAKKKVIEESYLTRPLLPVTDRPVKLIVQADDSLPFRASVNQSLIAMQQQFLLPFQWEATIWPRKNGWQHSRNRNNELYSWYVYTENDWQAIRAAETMRLNNIAGLQLTTSVDVTNELITNGWTRYSKLILIIIFMICGIYLWLEEKYHQSR